MHCLCGTLSPGRSSARNRGASCGGYVRLAACVFVGPGPGALARATTPGPHPATAYLAAYRHAHGKGALPPPSSALPRHDPINTRVLAPPPPIPGVVGRCVSSRHPEFVSGDGWHLRDASRDVADIDAGFMRGDTLPLPQPDLHPVPATLVLDVARIFRRCACTCAGLRACLRHCTCA